MTKKQRPQTIIRAPRNKDNPYFACRRASAQDGQLSFEARGVLWYLLSKPDNWEIKVEDLRKEGGIGRTKVYKLIQELTDHGYLMSEQSRPEDETGKTYYGPMIYRVREIPEPPDSQSTDFQRTEIQHTDFQRTENPIHTNKENIQREETTDVSIDKEQSMDTPRPATKPRPRDPYYDAVAEAWFDAPRDTPAFSSAGWRVKPLAVWLSGKAVEIKRGSKRIPIPALTAPPSADHLPAILTMAKNAWSMMHGDAHYPLDALKFIEFFDPWWRAHQTVLVPRLDPSAPPSLMAEAQQAVTHGD
jgi:hypothetical protein